MFRAEFIRAAEEEKELYCLTILFLFSQLVKLEGPNNSCFLSFKQISYNSNIKTE